MPMPTKAQHDRRTVVMGIVAVAAAILIVILDIVMPDALSFDDWVAFPAAVLLAFFGVCLIAAGLGYIKVRDEKWKQAEAVLPGDRAEQRHVSKRG